MTRAWPVKGLDPQASLAENARRILAVRIAEYYSYEPVIAEASASEALHDLRIAAKRLRYTLELFRSVFGDPGERQVKRLRAIQEELGSLHDTDVRIALIRNELNALAAEQTATVARSLTASPASVHQEITDAVLQSQQDDPRRGLIALLGREQGRRQRHYETVVALWNQFAAEGMRADLVGLSAVPSAFEAPSEASEVNVETATARSPVMVRSDGG
jgi:inorganic triphosphatase YgiF